MENNLDFSDLDSIYAAILDQMRQDLYEEADRGELPYIYGHDPYACMEFFITAYQAAAFKILGFEGMKAMGIKPY